MDAKACCVSAPLIKSSSETPRSCLADRMPYTACNQHTLQAFAFRISIALAVEEEDRSDLTEEKTKRTAPREREQDIEPTPI